MALQSLLTADRKCFAYCDGYYSAIELNPGDEVIWDDASTALFVRRSTMLANPTGKRIETPAAEEGGEPTVTYSRPDVTVK